MSVDFDISRFREHLTLDQCNRLLHFGHWIPINHGFTAKYVDEHYPGWTWNRLVQVFIAAGIHRRGAGGGPPNCDRRVKVFHFSSPTDFFVEWVDGVEPDDARERRMANDRTIGAYEFHVGSARFASIGGVDAPEQGD